MNHPRQHLYPILCHEFGTRFFDAELIDSVIAANKEAQEYFASDEPPFDWASMSLFDQVIAQISFISPPPCRPLAEEQAAEEALAKRIVAEIEAIQTSHHTAFV